MGLGKVARVYTGLRSHACEGGKQGEAPRFQARQVCAALLLVRSRQARGIAVCPHLFLGAWCTNLEMLRGTLRRRRGWIRMQTIASQQRGLPSDGLGSLLCKERRAIVWRIAAGRRI